MRVGWAREIATTGLTRVMISMMRQKAKNTAKSIVAIALWYVECANVELFLRARG